MSTGQLVTIAIGGAMAACGLAGLFAEWATARFARFSASREKGRTGQRPFLWSLALFGVGIGAAISYFVTANGFGPVGIIFVSLAYWLPLAEVVSDLCQRVEWDAKGIAIKGGLHPRTMEWSDIVSVRRPWFPGDRSYWLLFKGPKKMKLRLPRYLIARGELSAAIQLYRPDLASAETASV